MEYFKDSLKIILDIKYSKFIKKKAKFCKHNECNKQPTFNYINNKTTLYCRDHKLKNMIDIKSKKCIKCNNKIPSFNYENEKKALYCGDCKLENMIDIVHKKCIKCNLKVPNCNYLYEKKALYCGDCKLENMIDVISKKCIECNIKHASCNYIGKKIRLYCGDCKLENMISLKIKKCIKCNIKDPNFNYVNEKVLLYCGDCKLEGMVDIKSKKCISCKIKIPSFNYENEKEALYCKKCKLEDMIDIISKKCIKCKDTQPNYNYENEKKALYCVNCKLENMIDIKSKKCKTHLCNIQVQNKYKGYCLRCFINIFPDSKIIRDYGTREAKVIEFIKQEFKYLNIIYNKQIQGGCSNHRPDIFIDCLTHSVIIEVDEYQHKRGDSYSTRCEIRRVNELFTSLADRPIIFIRFNPDSYTNKKGKLIKSCFECTEERGLPKANKTLEARLNKLKEEIKKNINLIPNINITIIKLYYDGY